MRSLALALAVVAGAAAVAVGGAGGAGGQPALEIHRVDEGHFMPAPGGPVFVLVLGLDGDRPGLVGDRADAIHLIGVNPQAGAGTMLNIPRDAYVDVPGRGRRKINEAYFLGGPALAAETVERLTGVDVTVVLAVRFVPFAAMVDELGGVDVEVPIAMNDKNSGAVFPRGMVHMDGRAALAFSRNRYLPGGDVRRSEHQALVILAALAKLRAEGTGAGATLRYLAVLGRHASVDGVGFTDLYRLGRIGLFTDPARLRSVTMPSRVGSAGAQSVVFVAAGAPALFADLRDDAVLQAH